MKEDEFLSLDDIKLLKNKCAHMTPIKVSSILNKKVDFLVAAHLKDGNGIPIERISNQRIPNDRG